MFIVTLAYSNKHLCQTKHKWDPLPAGVTPDFKTSVSDIAAVVISNWSVIILKQVHAFFDWAATIPIERNVLQAMPTVSRGHLSF